VEASYPTLVQAAKERVVAADAVIIVTPKYNRSVPGVLKNALDWISHPYGTNPSRISWS
jgi:chromate reductase